MKKVVLSGLETALNFYLQLDPDTVSRLGSLEKKIIKIELTDLKVHFYLLPHAKGIHLIDDTISKPDATILGSSFSLFRLGASDVSSQKIFENAVTVKGDMDVAAEMASILKKVDIDWEEHLAKLVGDSIAHQCFYQTQQLINFGKEAIRSLGESTKEFLYYEIHLFPTKPQIEQLYRDIAELRNDVDRLAIRVERLFSDAKG